MKRPIIAAIGVAVATTLVLAGPVLTFERNNSLPRRFKFTAIDASAGRLCWFFRGRWVASRVPGLIDRFTSRRNVRCVGRACIGRRAATNLNFGPDYFAGPFEGPIKFGKGNGRKRNGGGCRFVQSSPGATHYNCWLNIRDQPATGEGSFQIELPPILAGECRLALCFGSTRRGPTATSPAGSAGAVANDDEVITPSSLHGADPPGYVLINLDHLVNLTSLEDERWKRAHPEFWGQFVIEER